MEFNEVSANPGNIKWNNMISRKKPLYHHNNDIRTEFERDYTRILHSTAYRRLKHKTQVFFSPENDHICTRIEHVNYVDSISYTISKYLGLNVELTKAIAIAHDLGHSPFGHAGEQILSDISMKNLGYGFWHEKNGLDFVDYIELLEDNEKNKQTLNLTYAVRDGIISHCGEINENNLKPRAQFIDLNNYDSPNQFSPYTWEACVVKIADKISYIGRDIEDAITVGVLDKNLTCLADFLKSNGVYEPINNTVLINSLVYDLCQNSSPENGLCFSPKAFSLINKIKEFNYSNIYLSKRLQPSSKYFNLVLNQIYNTLFELYSGTNTITSLNNITNYYPTLGNSFKDWLLTYWNINETCSNNIIFDIANVDDYKKGILYYISGMTDNFAIDVYNEIIGF